MGYHDYRGVDSNGNETNNKAWNYRFWDYLTSKSHYLKPHHNTFLNTMKKAAKEVLTPSEQKTFNKALEKTLACNMGERNDKIFFARLPGKVQHMAMKVMWGCNPAQGVIKNKRDYWNIQNPKNVKTGYEGVPTVVAGSFALAATSIFNSRPVTAALLLGAGMALTYFTDKILEKRKTDLSQRFSRIGIPYCNIIKEAEEDFTDSIDIPGRLRTVRRKEARAKNYHVLFT